MLYVGLGPSNWARNHNRRCANDNGIISASPYASALRRPDAASDF
jgi:hypothetical protein